MRLLRCSSLTAVVVLSLSTFAKADTIGFAAVFAPNVDTCTGCDYVVAQVFPGAGDTVTGYNFYANNAGDITPVLFTESTVGGHAVFTVSGVGASQTVSAGVNSFDFGLTQGSAVTDDTTYFGFYSLSPVVGFSYTSTPGVYFGTTGDTTVGVSFDGGENSVVLTDQLGGVNGRQYSINATAVTPEPSSLSLMGLGLAGVGALLKRKIGRRVWRTRDSAAG